MDVRDVEGKHRRDRQGRRGRNGSAVSSLGNRSQRHRCNRGRNIVARNCDRDPIGRLDVASPKSQTHVAPNMRDFFIADSSVNSIIGCYGQNVIFILGCRREDIM